MDFIPGIESEQEQLKVVLQAQIQAYKIALQPERFLLPFMRTRVKNELDRLEKRLKEKTTDPNKANQPHV